MTIILLTGSSGVGKTTLINSIENKGFTKFRLSAREILDIGIEDIPDHYDRMARDTRYLIDVQTKQFNHFSSKLLMLASDLTAGKLKGDVISERSLLDVAAYTYAFGVGIKSKEDKELHDLITACVVQHCMLSYLLKASVVYIPLNKDIPYDNDFGIRPVELIRNRADYYISNVCMDTKHILPYIDKVNTFMLDAGSIEDYETAVLDIARLQQHQGGQN